MESERERRKQQWRQRSEGEGAARSLRKRLTDVVLTKESCRTPEQKKLIALHHVKTSEIAEAMAAKASKKARQVDRALEKEDSPAELTRKLSILADMVREAASSAAGSRATSPAGVVLHTGAGLSTTAGIPDFRGPNGVWTMAAKGRQVAMGLTYEEAVPTAGHMAIAGLVAHGLVSHVVSQNGASRSVPKSTAYSSRGRHVAALHWPKGAGKGGRPSRPLGVWFHARGLPLKGEGAETAGSGMAFSRCRSS